MSRRNNLIPIRTGDIVPSLPQDGSETDTESSPSTPSSNTRRVSISESPVHAQNFESPSPVMSDSPSSDGDAGVQDNYNFGLNMSNRDVNIFPGEGDDLMEPLSPALFIPSIQPIDELPQLHMNHNLSHSRMPTLVLPSHNASNNVPEQVASDDTTTLSDNCFIYRLDNFPDYVTRRSEKQVSDTFVIDGLRWQILFFPVGNSVNNRYSPNPAVQSVSIFVQLLDTQNLPSNIQHKFKFTLIPPPGSSLQPYHKDSSHRFTTIDNDRGFSDFTPVLTALSYVHPPNKTLVIKVELTRSKITYSSNMWPDSTYDSKAVTGFVGLKNQGATCYMNSLLQTLFHLPPFRQLIYSLPTDDDPSARVPLSLQRVFYNLQTSDHAPSTKQLTAAFGWNSLEAFMQHDVQEFSRVLLDNLDERLKKTPLEGKVEEMFAGKVEMFIECVNVPYKSQRTETYFDLALNVKGCPTLAKSFEQYCEVETLDGDNKYRAENYGLQDARKGVRFLSFPPVLQLQLKRFEYNFERDMNVKLNDRFEFPLTIDLTPYVSHTVEPAPADDPHIYHLHSVLVHSGSGHGGHYYSFIKPFFSKLEYSKSPWFKFDDEHVTTTTTEDATVGNYGGETRTGNYYPRVSMANAYMLVYIRQRVTQEITQVVPEKLRQMDQGDLTKGEVHQREIVNPVVRSEGEVTSPVKAELDAALLAKQSDPLSSYHDTKDNVFEDASMPELSPPSDNENAEDEKMPPLINDVVKSPDDMKADDEEIDPLSLTQIDVPLPESLLQQFKREDELLREKRERAAREYLYTDLLLVSDQQLIDQSMTGLGVGWEMNVLHLPQQPAEPLGISDSQIHPIVPSHKVRALRTHTITEASAAQLKPRVEGEEGGYEWDALLGIPHEKQQFYRVTSVRPFRPSTLLSVDGMERIETVKEGVFVRDCSIDFDPEITAITGNIGYDLKPEHLIGSMYDRSSILCKAFDVIRQRAVYLGSLIVPSSMRLSDLEPLYRVLMAKRGFSMSSVPDEVMQRVNARRGPDDMHDDHSNDIPLRFSSEQNGACGYSFDVEYLDPSAPTVAQAGLRTGHILVAELDLAEDILDACAERWTPQADNVATVASGFQHDYKDYLQYVQMRLLVEIRVLSGGPSSKLSRTERVELVESMSYEQAVARIATCLQLDPSRVSLHKAHPIHSGRPEDKPITDSWQYKGSTSIIETFLDRNEPVLYVHVLEYTAQQLRDNVQVRVVYFEQDGREHSVKVLVPKNGCVRDMVIAARHDLLENRQVEGFEIKADDVFVYVEVSPPRDYIEGTLDEPIMEFLSCLSQPRNPPEVIVQECYDGLFAAKQAKQSNDQILSDDMIDKPVLRMVSRYFHPATFPTAFRHYSHMFSVVVPQNATAQMILHAIFKRLQIRDLEQQSHCKLAWTWDGGKGQELDLDSDDEVLIRAADQHVRLAFSDPIHFQQHQANAKALAAEQKLASNPYSFTRFNNAPIKFYP